MSFEDNHYNVPIVGPPSSSAPASKNSSLLKPILTSLITVQHAARSEKQDAMEIVATTPSGKYSR